ncbi:MAG: RdgB/HAM1 family non-canonical purine NTP pyrophosphatase [Planctomycetota bacterium]|nr:MAG: RdgB/HAM1 family non-canonical purine NTP pyrophosphatase [Planctomycetota bacterium]
MSSDIPAHILVATGNQHKIQEIAEILAPFAIDLRTPSDVGGLPAVIEDGETFADNAILKAESACRHSGLWALADDSGICARALGGAPGVYSARYAGEACDDVANNRKLAQALANHDDRHVEYVCVIALARPGKAPVTWEGRFAGRFVLDAVGDGGFGYDPHVFIDELGCTVAQMSAAEKHQRSHRGHALRQCAAWLAQHRDG